MYVSCFQFQSALGVNFYSHIGLTLLEGFLVLLSLFSDKGILGCCAAINFLHLFFIVELAVEFVELVCNRQEHHAPRGYWVIVILLNDSARTFESVLCTAEEIEVRLQIVVLDLQSGVLVFRIWKLVEKVHSFLNTVL